MRITRARIDVAHQRRLARLNAAQLRAAGRLLDDLLSAAARHGVALSQFDAVLDLPDACLGLIATRDHGLWRRGNRQQRDTDA